MTHSHETTNIGRVGRRRLLQGFGAAGFAVIFASACRGGSDDSEAASGTVVSATGGGSTSVTAGLETASTTMPAGTNPFDDYSYENAATGTQVRIWVQDGVRYIEANGLPDHETGAFPNANNPNAISEQSYSYEVAADPSETGTSTANGILDVFGIAINGVVFDPGAAEFWNNDFSSGWQLEPLSSAVNLGEDANNAHVQPTGGYHYHGMPEGLISGESGANHSPLIGFAADGFPIYARYGYADPSNASSGIVTLQSGYQLKSGTRPDGPGGSYDGSYVADYEYASSLGDLDENNGRSGVTPEYPGGTYYYVVTDDFPFIPRRFAGSPDSGFARGAPTAGVAGGPPRR
jgi:hypothetical protein